MKYLRSELSMKQTSHSSPKAQRERKIAQHIRDENNRPGGTRHRQRLLRRKWIDNRFLVGSRGPAGQVPVGSDIAIFIRGDQMATPSPASQASLDLDTDQTLRHRDFLKCVHQPHGHVDPCFMTGKGCVYTDQIDHVLKARLSANVSSGFMIIPFRRIPSKTFKRIL